VLSQFNTCAQAREEAAQGQLRDAQGGSGMLMEAQGCSGMLREALDSTATAQGCLLMAQVKTASAQAWKRNWHLVRSFFADDYIAIYKVNRVRAGDITEAI
jgi:hypothetical protein